MSQAFIVAELQGFTALTSAAAHRMDDMQLDAARFRGICESVFDQYIGDAGKKHPPIETATAGGDTWILSFDSLEEAVSHGIELMRLCSSALFDHGLSYLKPSLTLAMGRPKAANGRIIDDQTIAAYRQADNGYPFEFVLHSSAVEDTKALRTCSVVELQEKVLNDGDPKRPPKIIPRRMAIDWKSHSKETRASLPMISSVLLDSDVVFSDTAEKALSHLLTAQRKSSEILSFGGPINFGSLSHDAYVRSTVDLLQSSTKRWTLLSYLPINEPVNSLAWLELCRVLQEKFPSRFTAAAFVLQDGQLRPFSYQVFDTSTVHVGLRQYSPQKGTPTMSGAILMRNKSVASRFRNEFMDAFQAFGKLDATRYNELRRHLKTTPQEERQVFRIVDALVGHS